MEIICLCVTKFTKREAGEGNDCKRVPYCIQAAAIAEVNRCNRKRLKMTTCHSAVVEDDFCLEMAGFP